MTKKSPKKLTKYESVNAILARVRVPPVCLEVTTGDKSKMTGAHYDEVMTMPFNDKHDAVTKLRHLATLIGCSSGLPEGGGTIYVGLRRK